MKKAGYVIFFVSFGIFIPCFIALVFLLFSFFNMQFQEKKADDFLLSQPEHHHVNSSLNKLLDEGTTLKQNRDDSVLARYLSPEGIEFTSRSSQWDESDLQLLYEELLRNKHGDELYQLSNVVIYPQADETAAATHKNYTQLCSFPVSHTLLPKDFEFNFFRRSGLITLYDGDRITTVEGMADNLSHEYGHHFTRYYMLPGYGEELYDSEYAKLRGLTKDNSYTDSDGDESFYLENHYKYVLEIAAEDYVVLMGSPNARESVDYKDVMETLYTDDYPLKRTRCCTVQENLTIPMACETEGLADYFYGFLNEKAPEYDIKKEMNIRIKRHSQSYNLVGGYRTFVYYTVEFDKVYGEDAVYVVSAYDPENYYDTLFPIRTITKDEKALCYIGNTVRNMGSRVIYNDDKLAKGTKVFIVSVIASDGNMYTSSPFTYTF